MKKLFGVTLLLAVCLLWPALPLLAEATYETGEWATGTCGEPDVVIVDAEDQQQFEPTQELIDWWEEIYITDRSLSNSSWVPLP